MKALSRPVILNLLQLGRVPYAEGIRAMNAVVAARKAQQIADTLILLEHPPVLTLGRNSTRSNILASDDLLASRGVEIHEINRGGDVTYHGPGQLVGYPILDLRKYGQDLHLYLRAIEEALIESLHASGIASGRREGLTGVWVGPRKIASIGVGVRHWISMHGFALNVLGDLAPFNQIVPCGIAGVEMTSVEKESGAAPDMKEFALETGRVFEQYFTRLRENIPAHR